MSSILPPKSPTENKPKFSGDPDDYRLTLVEHLEELRTRIIRVAVAVTLGWAVGWVEFKPVYTYLVTVINNGIMAGLPKGTDYKEMFPNATEPFLLQLRLSFLIGMILAFPFIVIQLWGFVAPALKPNEQKPFKKLAPLSAALFVMGAGFAWYVTPSALKWFVQYLDNFPTTALYQQAGTMVFFVLKLLLAFGFAFQLPIVVYGMGIAGILSAETLLKYWRQSSFVIFVVAAIVTPSNDPVTMLAMAIPLVLLFIASVYAVKFVQRKKPPLGLD
jgi:sec-independent protein translocase protein TatC